MDEPAVGYQFSDHSEDLDTFDKQQELFQPCQLRYARNLVDLLSEEADDLRALLGKYQRDNLKLLSQYDEMVAEVKRIRGELMAWSQYKTTCHTSGAALANRLLPVLPGNEAERIRHNLVGEIAHLKRQLADAREALQRVERDRHQLQSQVRHLRGSF